MHIRDLGHPKTFLIKVKRKEHLKQMIKHLRCRKELTQIDRFGYNPVRHRS